MSKNKSVPGASSKKSRMTHLHKTECKNVRTMRWHQRYSLGKQGDRAPLALSMIVRRLYAYWSVTNFLQTRLKTVAALYYFTASVFQDLSWDCNQEIGQQLYSFEGSWLGLEELLPRGLTCLAKWHWLLAEDFGSLSSVCLHRAPKKFLGHEGGTSSLPSRCLSNPNPSCHTQHTTFLYFMRCTGWLNMGRNETRMRTPGSEHQWGHLWSCHSYPI